MNPITRKEMFLAAAGGQDVTTPTPVTREEVFLDEIAKEGGGSSLPSTETASAGDVLSLDDNKEPQWAAPSGSGGGVLVVHETVSGNVHTLDKTWQEISDAMDVGIVAVFGVDDFGKNSQVVTLCAHAVDYRVMTANEVTYITDSASGYPSVTWE